MESSFVGTAERRDGELKTYWTKPLYESSVYGFSIVDLSPSGCRERECRRVVRASEGQSVVVLAAD
jgi:hypothetical protein